MRWTPLSKTLLRVFHKPTKSNLKWLILSTIAAIFIWFYIAVTVYPSFSVQIWDVPVVVDVTDSAAARFGLSVLSPASESQKVDVVISGARTAIGGLTKEDIIAYVDFDSTVTDAVGNQTLPIRVSKKDGAVIANYTLSVGTLDVKMDRFQSSAFPVREVLYPNLTVSDEEVVINADAISCEPSTVTIYGPTSALAQVDHVRVTVTDSAKLYETRSFSDCTVFDLLDADGKVITDTAFQVQATSFVVKIPVIYTRTLPVSIDLSGVPSGFDETALRKRLRLNTDKAYSLPGFGEETLSIVIETENPSEKTALDALESWSLGTIPLSSLSLGGTPIEMPVTLEDGYEDRSNLKSVYVTLDEANLVAETRWINTADITIVNGSPSYHFTIPPGRFQVTIVGTAEEVKAVTAGDIRASVNLYNATASEEGTKPQAVTFVLPEHSTGVWVSGVTKVNVTATLLTEPLGDGRGGDNG